MIIDARGLVIKTTAHRSPRSAPAASASSTPDSARLCATRAVRRLVRRARAPRLARRAPAHSCEERRCCSGRTEAPRGTRTRSKTRPCDVCRPWPPGEPAHEWVRQIWFANVQALAIIMHYQGQRSAPNKAQALRVPVRNKDAHDSQQRLRLVTVEARYVVEAERETPTCASHVRAERRSHSADGGNKRKRLVQGLRRVRAHHLNGSQSQRATGRRCSHARTSAG
jgi:hypothetical protein